MSADAKTAKKAPKAISLRLSLLFVGLLIASILVAELLVLGFGYGLVKDLIDTSLTNQVTASAAQVNKDLSSTFYYLNGVADKPNIRAPSFLCVSLSTPFPHSGAPQ